MLRSSSLLAPIAKRLEGKVAIITGGASGIGLCTTKLFVRHGAKVIVADVQDSLGKSLCEEIDKEIPDSVSFVHCDVRSDPDVESLVDHTVDKYGKLDIMFSNAGISPNTDPTISSIEYNDFKRVLDVNTFGALACAKHAARAMIPAKRGSIVFTSSIASVSHGNYFPYAYLASKHAVVGLTKNLCVELGKYGVRVNCVSPFAVATPMFQNYLGTSDKQKVEKIISESGNLKETTLEADDIAEAALYLGSDQSKYVSGINLVVDGGYTTTNSALSVAIKELL